MSDKFNRIVEHTLKFEGGYVNDPDDPGGATNYGISLRYLKTIDKHGTFDYDKDGDLDAVDIKHLTKTQAKQIYLHRFWRPEYEHLHEHRRKLEGLQFRIDGIRKTHTPMAACLQLSEMMHNKLFELREACGVDHRYFPHDYKEEKESKTTAKVLPLKARD